MTDARNKDPLEEAIGTAFKAIVDAEEYIYAGGMQDLKEEILTAHSAVLSLRNQLDAMRRERDRS